MGTSCVALSIKNIKTRASREMTSQQKWGERCQALECGRARYLLSLIALFVFVLQDQNQIVASMSIYYICTNIQERYSNIPWTTFCFDNYLIAGVFSMI